MSDYKVLIVDDDPMVAMINEQYVRKNKDFQVSASCKNGKEAIEYLENNKVDLVVLDVYMPVMDGVETLKCIREKNIQVEVIMVTAANDTATLEETMHLGVLDYLIKPFDFERFQIALEKFSAKYSVLKKNTTLDQNCIDRIITTNSNSKSTDYKYPKGIQKRTLDLVVHYFDENPNWTTVDKISEVLGISIVTIRHYLSYLVEENKIKEDLNYETGGRPCMLYKKNL